MTGEAVELVYPAIGGIGAQIAQNRAPISAVKFLGSNANRKAYDILVGLAGTYGQKYIPSGHRAGVRMAAAGAVWDLAKTFYSERTSTSTTGADVPVLDYQQIGGGNGATQQQPQGFGVEASVPVESATDY